MRRVTLLFVAFLAVFIPQKANALVSLNNIACMASATTGTGTITLGAAVTGFLSFSSAGVVNNQIVSYSIIDGTQSEVGRGTYSSGGPTLARTTIYTSTNSNTAISLDGSEQICVSQIAQDFIDQANLGRPEIAPDGRLTLTAATPVMTANTTGVSAVYYDCYIGNDVPFYDGTNDEVESISSCEVSMTMATSGTGVTNSGGVFDVWWVHSGANRICVATNGSGGGWASDTGGSNTARGTGYSQLDKTSRGYVTNKNSITHCYNGTTDYGSISANQATYLGSLYTTAAGKTDMNFNPAGTTGGNNSVLGLYNAFNKVPISALSNDTTASWAYAVSGTWRAADGSANNAINYIDGMGDVTVFVVNLSAATGTTSSPVISSNRDSTTVSGPTEAQGATPTTATVVSLTVANSFSPSIGFHTIYCLEEQFSASTTFESVGIVLKVSM